MSGCGGTVNNIINNCQEPILQLSFFISNIVYVFSSFFLIIHLIQSDVCVSRERDIILHETCHALVKQLKFARLQMTA